MLFLLLAVLLALSAPAAAGAIAEEYALKAAFLYNFTLFTEWPGAAGGVRICVLGQDPFGGELDRYAGRETPKGPVRISRIESAREARHCQVLFIAASEHGRMAQIREELGDRPPLTITEANGFDRRMVMIVLVPVDSRVGFEVNLTAARQAGLNLNPKMLRLARGVY